MPIQIVFLDDKLRNLCECRGAAERLLGSLAARRLRSRLSDIRAAKNINEVVAGSPQILPRAQVAFVLHPPHRLVLEPTMKPIVKNKHGETDWDAIDSFRVIRVGN